MQSLGGWGWGRKWLDLYCIIHWAYYADSGGRHMNMQATDIIIFFATDVFGGNLKYILESGIIRKVHESWCYWKNQGKVIFPVYQFFHYFYTVPFFCFVLFILSV